jgi:ribosomal protein S18 acetylase RimI-like enzyme
VAEYEVRAQVPTVGDYIRIRLAAGLSRKTEEAATIGLKNSHFAVMVFYADEPVGIGRVVGDGGCFLEIVDIAVLPKHQQKGVGTLIMDALMAYVNEHAPKSAYVSLMADHGTPAFYEKFGFVRAELPKAAGTVLRVL